MNGIQQQLLGVWRSIKIQRGNSYSNSSTHSYTEFAFNNEHKASMNICIEGNRTENKNDLEWEVLRRSNGTIFLLLGNQQYEISFENNGNLILTGTITVFILQKVSS